ncbi:hypothetical protein [Pajaroellobacter abortibovis]|uniref:hypothetical protein n=1 Tax=Pajaroellobacter abortibovis TaxID=1882918 RepID=UPI0012EC4625|nr:hypothetical protein [Pajaroellobacter abortibovis]
MNTTSAQEFLRDRKYQGGIGVQVGAFELHPGLAVEGGYDSNWFLRSSKEGADIVNGASQAPVEGAGMLRVTPSLSFGTQQARNQEQGTNAYLPYEFRTMASGSYLEFIGSSDVRSQRNMNANFNGGFDLFRGRPWGGSCSLSYRRYITPSSFGDTSVSFNRDTLNGRVDVIATPGGGTLELRVGYQSDLAIFEQFSGRDYNNLSQQLVTQGQWKFRPRTSLVYDGMFGYSRYIADRSQHYLWLPDTIPIRTRLGVMGLLTHSLGIYAVAGYGAMLSTANENKKTSLAPQFDSVIGTLELMYFWLTSPSPDYVLSFIRSGASESAVGLGYNRDFQNSYVGTGFYGVDRVYARLNYFFKGRFLISAQAGVAAIRYPMFLADDGSFLHDPSTDIRLDGTLFGEYRFSNAFGLIGTLKHSYNSSQVQLEWGNGRRFDFNWNRFEAFAGVRWVM